MPKELKYTKEHEWVRIEGNEAVVGVSDYAQSSLGDVTFVKLPEVGKEVKQFEEIGFLESVKAVSSLYSPLSGRIIQVNTALEESPDLINKSCYGDGWIYQITGFDNSEVNKLLSADEYEEYLRQDKP